MKKRIVFIILIVVIILLLLKLCSSDNTAMRLKDGSKPSVALLNIKILNQTKESIHFSLSFAVLRDSKNSEDGIKRNHLVIDSLKNPPSAFKLSKFSKTKNSTKEPFSAILLVDQSGSMTSNDKENKRFKSAKIFNKNFGEDNYLMLWAFGLRGSSYKSFSKDFVKDTFLFENQIDSLIKIKPSGSSPLFKAQDSTIQYLNQFGKTKLKPWYL